MRRSVQGVLMGLLAIAATGAACAQTLPGFMNDISRLKEGRSMRASSSDVNWATGNGDARPIEPGATLVLAELEGPGIIQHIWNTIASTERGYSRLLVLRMYWDGEQNPSVECPIGDFFGVGHGMDVPYDSLPVRVSSDGRGRNCYWPMPFKKSAKITVTNEGKKRTDAFYYYIDWMKVPRLSRNAAYFHAMYRQEFPATMGQRYLIADIKGRGHYAGTVLNCRQTTASWFGEGDDFFYIDGETEPSLRGTGTEDYFCDGWGFRVQNGAFYGAPLFEGFQRGNRTSVYRWHLTDPVNFEESLRVEIEHVGPVLDQNGKQLSGYGERPDDFSSVAFWYQKEPHAPYAPIPAGYARLNYDYTKIVEAEAVIPNVSATAGPIEKQDGGWSGGAQLFWTPQAEGQTLTIPFTTPSDGSFEITLLYTRSHDYGIFQYEIDGAPIGEPVDQFNPSISNREKLLPEVSLKAGEHKLTVKNVGKNSASTGFYYGLDGWMIQAR